jgi:hypothetical protein
LLFIVVAGFVLNDAQLGVDELQQHNNRVQSILLSLKWINVQAKLLDICVAFYPLDLPPYVLLEIVDRFPFWSTHVNHKKKIDYIIQIKKFCDDLIEKRKRMCSNV